MAAELITPVDEISGLPLPIVPTCEEELPLDNSYTVDYHHGFHPYKELVKNDVAADIALRSCWIQRAERRFHNETETAYHRFYLGPVLPTDTADKFSRIVLACAGYIPDRGIDLRGGDPVEVDLMPRQKEYLRTPHPDNEFAYRYINYRYEPIRDFFREYLLKQDLSHVENLIDSFLHNKDYENKRFLGHLLLAQAAEVATDNIREKYSFVKKAGLLHAQMPAMPQTLVKYKLGRPDQREELIPDLELELRQRFAA